MLSIGVQTKGIVAKKGEILSGFERIKAAGFDKVDFNLDDFLMNSAIYAGELNPFFDRDVQALTRIFRRYREAMDQYGLEPSQMHAPYPVRVQAKPEITAYMQGNVIPKSILIAEVLRVPWVVMHPFKLQYTHGKMQERVENIEYFKAIMPLLKQCGVKVCVENLYEGVGGRIVEGVCADPDEAVWYVDTLNDLAGEEMFGFCLDTGHLQLVKRDPYAFIMKLGKRIKVLHIHENDGKDDLHQIPYSFGSREEGGADWDKIYKGLKDIGFDGTLSFETFPSMNSFPRFATDATLSAIHEVGVYMREQIEKA